MDTLPIDALLPAIRATLVERTALVIEAPPGAGKTTRVPPALLDAPWLTGQKILMLEPRRLAARAAAAYMARQRGEMPGGTVGYRMRMETRVGRDTRIEVVTEGVLTRLLQADPALTGYGAVIFDEFHERSLHADLGLALCLEARAALRPELRLVVMSATLDAEPVARLLGGASRLVSKGRSFPVATGYKPAIPGRRLDAHVAECLRRVFMEETGSVLVFLPGGGEIRRVAARLAGQLPPNVELHPLYGDLPLAEQDAAIRPAPPGKRKLVLATAIAESSLTIEGVRVVVDAGLARLPRFDPVSGLTRLVTTRVSRASGDQRRGRAGRLEPGVCYRLWSEGERLEAQTPPEILQADLAPLALELAQWGAADISRLAWLDPPPAAALSQAQELLRELEALGTEGRITAHGRRLLELPLHPRLAHMVVKAAEAGEGSFAAMLAALLSERDVLPPGAGQTNLGLRVALLGDTQAAPGADRQRLKRVAQAARDIAQNAGVSFSPAGVDEHAAGRWLALAYPDRIARRRAGGAGRYQLANGRGAWLAEADPLAASEWLAVAALDGDPREARIFLAAALDEADLEQMCMGHILEQAELRWDEASEAVMATLTRRLGAIVLDQRPLANPDPERVMALMLEAIRRRGLECLPWTPALRQWQQRVLLLRRLEAEAWPDVSDVRLLATLEDWLAPFLAGRTRLAHLADLPLRDALHGRLDYRQQRQLEERAPTHVSVPTGSRISVDYSGETPVLAVRLQEMFGLKETPAIAGGRVPLLLHLLSPAGRPVQVTRDLAGFWRSSYQDVRKDMKGRYPKHPWPEDPLTAPPTRRAKAKR